MTQRRKTVSSEGCKGSTYDFVIKGGDGEGIVAPGSKLNGVEGVGEAKACFMPRIISSNTAAAITRIARKATDIVVEDQTPRREVSGDDQSHT